MRTHMGTVEARKMSRLEYVSERGRFLTDEDDPKEVGYEVKHGELISWMPFEVFESCYSPL